MVELDDWDKLSRSDATGVLSPIVETDPGEATMFEEAVDLIAPQLLQAMAELEIAKAKAKHLTEDLARFAPELAGEVIVQGKDWTVTVKRTERMEWDSDVLAALYSGKEDLPSHIKMKLSVDKRRYERMQPDDRDALRSALTLKLSAPAVEVRPNV